MMDVRFFAVSACLGACAAACGLEVSFADREGRPLDCAGRIDVAMTRRIDAFGTETVTVEARSMVEEPLYARIVAKERVAGADVVWDGLAERRKPKAALSVPLLCKGRFLMGAAWNAAGGVALALGAEDLPSFADLDVSPDAQGAELAVSVPAAFLRKGARFVCTFHRIAFSPKYGIRDALARYYPLYPARFRRDPRVNPALYGANAQYASWQRSDPEACRFMDATCEWCYSAARTWGDPLSREEPVGEQNTRYCWSNNNSYTDRNGRYHNVAFKDMSNGEFIAMQDRKLANARYCGVANAFYMMALANISNAIAERHPDSLVANHPCADNHYPYAAEVFTFPECSWGRELRRQLAELVREKDIGGIAFDVSRPSSIYRGERLAGMDNVGWDGHGAGVVRGVGSAKLFDYIRTLPNKRLSGNCGVMVNTKDTVGHHLSDILHMDTMMSELPPWSREPPYPLNMRLHLGEKGLTLWEGYSPAMLAPNYSKWDEADRHTLIRDLARYAVHRSLATGAMLPCAYLTEYTGLMSHALSVMSEEGWKPVIGAAAEGEQWELSRYGLGDRSFIALCNETNSARRARLTVWTDEIESGMVGGAPARHEGILYAPFFGGAAEIECGNPERVSCDVGPLLVNVLEAAGFIDGSGRLSAEWSGDFDAVRMTLRSADFAGEVRPRAGFGTYVREGEGAVRLEAGGQAVVTYRNTALPGLCGRVRGFPFADENGKRAFFIEYADDGASKDMADRMEFFFWRAMDANAKRSAKAIRRNGRKPYVECRLNPALPPRTVVLRSCRDGVGPISVSAPDDEAFSRLVRRAINVINVEGFPGYGPEVGMLDEERVRLPFRRL